MSIQHRRQKLFLPWLQKYMTQINEFQQSELIIQCLWGRAMLGMGLKRVFTLRSILPEPALSLQVEKAHGCITFTTNSPHSWKPTLEELLVLQNKYQVLQQNFLPAWSIREEYCRLRNHGMWERTVCALSPAIDSYFHVNYSYYCSMNSFPGSAIGLLD